LKLFWATKKWTKINVQKKFAEKSFETRIRRFLKKVVCEHNALVSVFWKFFCYDIIFHFFEKIFIGLKSI
jgi:hypothetical protein